MQKTTSPALRHEGADKGRQQTKRTLTTSKRGFEARGKRERESTQRIDPQTFAVFVDKVRRKTSSTQGN